MREECLVFRRFAKLTFPGVVVGLQRNGLHMIRTRLSEKLAYFGRKGTLPVYSRLRHIRAELGKKLPRRPGKQPVAFAFADVREGTCPSQTHQLKHHTGW